ncbi:hypothetical protein ASG25_13990 [Rhizobium sp. Leaf384]|uniref:hypothetical protein n=1 Tax=unclassified Rhizobium TaxID=2613769 RepID=UPI000712791C|nr:MULTISPECIES: hypothetical protein [unclassified Rhizobium]KQS77694.1 hypothetical protein ASG25_13990 [Rhizobium sp. Leaf384]KQS84528.1 hypothetical protein ASG58_20550 [Rhizobium sp. Leaf383]
MIQFALMFALGFLSAVLLGALVAPVVHRRIVRFAEDRLKATTPLSQQEVRAQKDAARAIYAAENVRTSQTLKRERDKAIALMLAREKAEQEMRTVRAENEDLRAQLDVMNVEAGDLRSGIRLLEQHIERLKEALASLETDYAAKTEQAAVLARQLDRVSGDLDEMRAVSAAEALQIDELHARAGGLRDERETLRDERRRASEKAKALELKLEQQEVRAKQVESRLTTANALLADRETSLQRGRAEIDRLMTRVREMTSDLATALQALRAAGIETRLAGGDAAGGDAAGEAVRPPVAEETAIAMPAPEGITRLPAQTLPSPDELRAEAGAFLDRLVSADPGEDAALRNDLLTIAAGMTALTARNEGAASPIPALLARETADAGTPTLAARTRSLLASTS